MQMALSSPRPLREVTEIADKQIKPQLENINGSRARSNWSAA